MGCWEETCLISGLPIISGTKVMSFLYYITYEEILNNVKFLTLPIIGYYNDYGSIENIENNIFSYKTLELLNLYKKLEVMDILDEDLDKKIDFSNIQSIGIIFANIIHDENILLKKESNIDITTYQIKVGFIILDIFEKYNKENYLDELEKYRNFCNNDYKISFLDLFGFNRKNDEFSKIIGNDIINPFIYGKNNFKLENIGNKIFPKKYYLNLYLKDDSFDKLLNILIQILDIMIDNRKMWNKYPSGVQTYNNQLIKMKEMLNLSLDYIDKQIL